MSEHWFDHEHEEYQEWYPKWIYSQDHYEAEVLDKARTYLQQREQGESDDAFDERIAISEYHPLLGHVIDSLAGMLFAVEDKGERMWENPESSESLGDPNEDGTTAKALAEDCDGEGTDWVTKWKTFAIDLIVNQKIWVLIEGKNETRPYASVRIVNPTDVPDWAEDDSGRLTEVKVSDFEYDRDSIKDIGEHQEVAIVYTLDGWEKHKKIIREVGTGADKRIEVDTELIDEGAYHYEDRNGNNILPIYPVELPIRRYIAYILAQKNNAIFNKESAKDFLEWVACFPVFNVFGNNDLFESVVESLKEGQRVLQNKDDATNAHSFEAPSTEPAQRLAESLKEKVEMFLFVAYQQFSDSARERTATEVRQDLSKGIGAFLELLAGAVDEAENNAFWRIEQAQFPAVLASVTEDGERTEEQLSGNREIWGQAHVERSSDFMPIDIEQRIKDMIETFFGVGGNVPLTVDALLEAAQMIAKHYNIEVDLDDLRPIIEQRMARRTQSDDFTSEIDNIVNGGG